MKQLARAGRVGSAARAAAGRPPGRRGSPHRAKRSEKGLNVEGSFLMLERLEDLEIQSQAKRLMIFTYLILFFNSIFRFFNLFF